MILCAVVSDTLAALGTVQTFTVAQTFQKTALGTTPTAAVIIQNTTPAANGAQQYSPSSQWIGQGFGGGVSQQVIFQQYLIPVQGVTNPTGTQSWGFNINGAGYAQALSLTSAGLLALAGLLQSVASTTSSAGFNIPQGTAPTSPNNGDLWTTAAAVFAQINGATQQLLPTNGNGSALTGITSSQITGLVNQGTGVTTGSEGTLAATGSVQGDAAPIVTDNVEISGADNTKGAILPNTAGARIFVHNSDGSHSLKIYPHSGAQIATAGTNTALSIGANSLNMFIRTSTTQWHLMAVSS